MISRGEAPLEKSNPVRSRCPIGDVPGKGLAALLWAPVYVFWKVALMLKGAGQKRGEWVRTARESQKP